MSWQFFVEFEGEPNTTESSMWVIQTEFNTFQNHKMAPVCLLWLRNFIVPQAPKREA